VRLVKIGIAATNPTVGAVDSNVERLIRLASRMADENVTIACFPEQAIGGYPAEDLVQWREFVEAQWTACQRFASATAEAGSIYVLGLVVATGGQLFNAAAVVHRGRVLGIVPKEELPTYGVFYERRTFTRGAAGLHLTMADVPLGDYLFAFDTLTLAVEVCEDAWSPDGPMRRRCYSGADVVVNISSSPFRIGIQDTRREMLATRSHDNQATLVYANRVGGQDGLVFDGGGFVFQNGRRLLEAPRFRDAVASCVVDLDRTTRLRRENTTWRTDWEQFQRDGNVVPAVRSSWPVADRSALRYPAPEGGSFFLPPPGGSAYSKRDEALDELYEALALGVKDYVAKTRAFRRIGVALSGGRDSLLALLVAWRATHLLEDERGERIEAAIVPAITAWYMPSRFSGEAARRAAERICAELRVELRVSDIDEAFQRELLATRHMLADTEPSAVTSQNAQARLRGMRMWNWANSTGALFLQTSDMSERAVGYVTMGGDLEGSLSVIANVPKTVVSSLLERLHARYGFEAIAMTLATAPSPELASAQLAEAELMPFPILDACLHLYAGEKCGLDELVTALSELFPTLASERLREHAARFVDLFTRSIYKWVQAPLTLHVGSLDLDRERALQLPVVQQNEWAGGPR
jgi:NAD+ synthase (glutamine-hydrolysing)